MTSSRAFNKVPGNGPRRIGTCRLCGGHNRELRIVIVADFWDWACEQCARQVAESLPRRYVPAGEETEPNE